MADLQLILSGEGETFTTGSSYSNNLIIVAPVIDAGPILWPYPVIGMCSLTLVLLTSVVHYHNSELNRKQVWRNSIVYELTQLFLRAATVTLATVDCVRRGLSTWAEVTLLGYIFLLGFASLVFPLPASIRKTLSHHALVITVVDLIIEAGQVAPRFILLHRNSALPLWVGLKLLTLVFGVLLAFVSPRRWNPANKSFGLARHRDATPSPEQTCSNFSYYMSYGWMTDLILRGANRRLNMEDILPLPEYDEPILWRERMREARARFSSTFKALAYTLRWTLASMVLFASLTALVEFIAPLALYCVLGYLQDPAAAVVSPWVWVLLLFGGPVLRSASYQQYLFSSTRLIVRIKMCLIQELYSKASKCLDTSSADDKISGLPVKDALQTGDAPDTTAVSEVKFGNIINLMAYDVDAIANSRDFILICVTTPIEFTIGLLILKSLFGWACVITLAIMLSSFPIAAVLSRRMSNFQRKVMKKTDKRISMISEFLSSIRTVKYLAWEHVIARKVESERDQEQSLTWKRNLSSVAVVVLGDFVPLFALFSLFSTYTLVWGGTLTASKAFTSLSVVETFRQQFMWIANVTRFFSQARISFDRIDGYITGSPETTCHPEGPPSFKHAILRRALAEDSFRLHLNTDFVVGGLNVITGPSGSGKSSLLLSLIGETILETGSVQCPKDAAYASQVPWLLNDHIRANIVLHEEFDRARYDQVIMACGLLPDLQQFDKGDLTNVGANGSTLSGGQRQRVALARTMYARSELLLLDDVFSALDSMTQKHIWEHCFHGQLVRGRTVILVTQMQAAINESSLLMKLSQGHVESCTRSSIRDIVDTQLGAQLGRLATDTEGRREIRHSSSSKSDAFIDCHQSQREMEQKISDETQMQARNPRSLFYQYMLLFGGHRQALLAIVLCFLAQVAFFGVSLSLAVWVGAYSRHDAANVGFYVATYAATLTSFSLFSALSQTYFQWGAWKVARSMHRKLLSSVLSVPISWYDKNPPGRVVNRFSRDIYSLDSVLVDYLRTTLDNGLRLLLRLCAIGSVMPVFAIPAGLVCAFAFVCAEMYTRTQLSVKALASASLSPIFSFFGESLVGNAIVNCRRGLHQAFADELARRLRSYARAAETQYNLNRWICVRADASAAVIAFATGVIAISFAPGTSAGIVGFSLTNAIGLGQTILNLVRNMNELEIELNSFYRVKEYASLEPEEREEEEGLDVDTALPSSWPSKGEVEFRNVVARYSKDGSDILRGVSFTVAPGERVAVIGRTGSGKSTLALSLFRFTQVTSGSIFIDGVDVSTVSPKTLRSRLTFTPQEPVLFSGDVRFNLDPSTTITTERLTDAISACSVMQSLVTPRNESPKATPTQYADGGDESTSSGQIESETPALNLDSAVAAAGANFSVGQRQVLSFARTIARRSQVVILDEFTASVDAASEAAIQGVLRHAFQDKTIMSIVHRLPTTLDYDRVIVMDAGRVREMGSPLDLYHQHGIFHNMVKESIHQGKGGEWTVEKLKLLEPGERKIGG